jgi:hypothetical protein
MNLGRRGRFVRQAIVDGNRHIAALGKLDRQLSPLPAAFVSAAPASAVDDDHARAEPIAGGLLIEQIELLLPAARVVSDIELGLDVGWNLGRQRGGGEQRETGKAKHGGTHASRTVAASNPHLERRCR